MSPWGWSLMINAAQCCPKSIRSAVVIKNFVEELVPAIQMKAYGRPSIVHFGTDGKMGYTLVQLIETSNITAHFCEETGDVYADIFSCKAIDVNIAIKVFSEYFYPEKLTSQLISRSAPIIRAGETVRCPITLQELA